METLNLTKGDRIDLTKTNPGLSIIGIGLGWDVASSGQAFDLDSFIIPLKEGSKLHSLSGVVFFGNLTGFSGGIKHSGDNLTGAGDGDDEVIIVDLTKIPEDVTELMVGINIYSAESRNQNFGKVNNAFCRLFDKNTNVELSKYDLTEDFSSATGMILGRLYRHSGEWKFQAMGEPKTGNIQQIAETWK